MIGKVMNIMKSNKNRKDDLLWHRILLLQSLWRMVM